MKTFAPRPMLDFWLFMGGPIIWALHFNLLYFAQSWFCVTSERPHLVFGAVTAVGTLAALGGIAAALYWFRERAARAQTPEDDDALPSMLLIAAILSGLSAVAVVWYALPVAVLNTCGA